MPTDPGYRYYVESIVDAVPLPAGRRAHHPPPVRAGVSSRTSTGSPRGDDDRRARPTPPASRRRPRRSPPHPCVDLVAIDERMAASSSSFTTAHPPGPLRPRRGRGRRLPSSTAVAASLDELGDGRTARRSSVAWRACRRATRVTRRPRIGDRIVRLLREYDARRARRGLQRRPAQRHGGARVRPERQAAAGLHALENRAYLGELVDAVTARRSDPGLHRGQNRAPGDARTSRSSSRRTAGPGRAIGVVGVLGPTRMSYPQAIGTVRFVGGLMNELVDTSMPDAIAPARRSGPTRSMSPRRSCSRRSRP